MNLLCSSDQEFLLRRGRVPAPRLRNIRRTRLLEKLYAKIRFLVDNKAQWLVIYGVVGCGKTQLIVDLLWDRPELSLVDFKRIFWLTDRNLTASYLTDLARDALILLSTPTDDDENFFFESKSGADMRNFLGSKIHAKLREFKPFDKVLFVLDGVMNVETIRFFDEFCTANCYFVATSTSREVFSTLERLCSLRITSGTDVLLADWMQMATSYGVKITATNLKALIEATGQNFALMEKVFHLARGDSKIIPSLLYRIRFRPLREINCNSAYHHRNLEEPLRLCFKMIDDQLCSAFERCVPFEPLQPIHFKILKAVWPMDLCGQETNEEIDGMLAQDLKTLVWNSLLEATQGSDKLEDPYDSDENINEQHYGDCTNKKGFKFHQAQMLYYSNANNTNFDEPGAGPSSSTISNGITNIQHKASVSLNHDSVNNKKSVNSTLSRSQDNLYYWIQPMILSFLIHIRSNNYKKFQDCVKSVYLELKMLSESDEEIFAKYFVENSRRLKNLESWAELLRQKKVQQLKEVEKNQNNAQTLQVRGPTIFSLQILANILAPVRIFRNFLNFLFFKKANNE